MLNMLDYKVKIGLCPMRRDTTNRPAKTFLTWVSAEERGHRFVKYIEENFADENVEFVDANGLGCNDLIFLMRLRLRRVPKGSRLKRSMQLSLSIATSVMKRLLLTLPRLSASR